MRKVLSERFNILLLFGFIVDELSIPTERATEAGGILMLDRWTHAYYGIVIGDRFIGVQIARPALY